MKIDPTDKQSPIYSSHTVQPVREATAKENFAKVLGETVQKASEPKIMQGNAVHALSGPNLRLQPAIEAHTSQEAHGLLNALENYQKLLEDSSASMRAVSSAVEKMRVLSENASTQLDLMPEGHPVKMIVQETLVHISKEVKRFDMGYYIDD